MILDDKLFAQLIFCRAVSLGSRERAFASLEVDKETGDRLLRELEDVLGTRLFDYEGTSEKVSHEGQRLSLKWRQSLEALYGLSTSAKDESLKTLLRFSFPTTSGTTIFSVLTSEFANLHPSLRFDVIFTHGSYQRIWDQLDLLVVHGPYRLDDVVEMPLGGLRRIIVASPEYLKKGRIKIARPEDLNRPDIVGTRDTVETGHIRLFRNGKSVNVKNRPRILMRNQLAAFSIALSGNGIGVGVPQRLAQPYLDNGQLVRILPKWEMSPLTFHAVWSKSANPLVPEFGKYLQDFFIREEIGPEACLENA